MNEEIVKLESVTKAYHLGGGDVAVLKGVDMLVLKNEFVGIMGASGSGKSTLLNILGLLDNPTGGRYFLDGEEVEHLSDNRLAELRNACIGFIFQNFNLSNHLNVEQNIEMPLVYGGVPRRQRKETAREMAEKVGLGHRLKHRPTELSGGECQRVAVARSMANHPSFLLADEPTGNLDEHTGAEIMKLFHELQTTQNVTIIMVTHNPDYEAHFDRVIYLRDGAVCDPVSIAND